MVILLVAFWSSSKFTPFHTLIDEPAGLQGVGRAGLQEQKASMGLDRLCLFPGLGCIPGKEQISQSSWSSRVGGRFHCTVK